MRMPNRSAIQSFSGNIILGMTDSRNEPDLRNVSSTAQLTEDQSKLLSSLSPNGRLAWQKTVRSQGRQQVDHEVHKTPMSGMLHLACVFQKVVHRLYHGTLAQKQLVPDIHQHVFHVLFVAVYASAMARFYRRGVDEAYAGHCPSAESLGVQGQRHQACAHKLHEPVVADKAGKISPMCFAA